MTDFFSRLGKLITVKAIIALVLTGVYAYLAISGHIEPDAFENIFILVVGFYFGQTSERTTKPDPNAH